jgi:IclR family KDG regulon transcriptional repressor
MVRSGGRQRMSVEGQMDEDNDFFVRALARGLTILALFDIEHPEWGLNEICERTGMSKTTAYRMVRTLEAKDYLVHDPSVERYHLGGAAIPGAYLAMSFVGFVRAAHPFLERLAETTGETVEFTVRSAEGAVVVDEVATIHPFRLNRPTGRILYSIANSSFRLHTAYRPLAEQVKILRSPAHLPPSNAMTDADEVIRRMAAERVDGLTWDLEEQDKGVCAVSAPVLEPDGSLKAVITVVAPAERFGPRVRKRKAEALRTTAAELTKYLGGRGR